LFLMATQGFGQIYFPPTTGTTWATTAPATLGYQQAQIDSLYNYLDRTNSKAFILLKDGKIVLEKYFDSFTQDSIWQWNSAGKTLTGFCVGIAQQEGRLSINTITSDIIGNGWTTEPLAKERLITVRHQLTMTSGIDDNVADLYCTLPSCLGYLTDAGTRWAYHNAVYTRLDTVLQLATGLSINAYFITKVRNRIGMNGAFYKVGYNNLYVSTPRSMARFGLLIQNKGSWGSTPILTDTAYYRQMTNTSNPYNLSYGYLWWLNGKASYMSPQIRLVFPGSFAPNAPADMFAGIGKDGQIMSIVPSQGLVLIRMGETPNTGSSGQVPTTYVNDIWAYINRLQPNAVAPRQMPKIAPNPTTGTFYIDALAPSGFVTDALGRIVCQVNSQAVRLDGQAAGLYVLHLKGYAPVKIQKD
jgi:CubicO group peptidase (beta-lactamase class C family)